MYTSVVLHVAFRRKFDPIVLVQAVKEKSFLLLVHVDMTDSKRLSLTVKTDKKFNLIAHVNVTEKKKSSLLPIQKSCFLLFL
jgi:hypothetical protein